MKTVRSRLILKTRLEKLYEGSKSANAQEGFDLFWSFVEDEIDESGFEETEDEDTVIQPLIFSGSRAFHRRLLSSQNQNAHRNILLKN